MSDLIDRYRRSLGRVGLGISKNARWFLQFVKDDPACFVGPQFEQCWDDLVTLCQLGETEGRKRPNSRTSRPNNMLKVRIGKGTTLVYDNRRYASGAVLEVPESIAIGLVRGSSAEYVSPPPIIRHERQTTDALLNTWENAATWPSSPRLADGAENASEKEARFKDYIVEIHRQIRTAVMDYLAGAEPVICLRQVCVRLGPAQLLPATPFSVGYFTEDGHLYPGVEAAVLVRFIQVFTTLGERFRRCPSCQEIFVANRRKDQRACSGLCRAKVGMRRLREERRKLVRRRKSSRREVKRSKTYLTKGVGRVQRKSGNDRSVFPRKDRDGTKRQARLGIARPATKKGRNR